MIDTIDTESRFARTHGGKPFFAEVFLCVQLNSLNPGIEFRCSGSRFSSQGCIENVSAIGYEHWKSGARAGVEFALSIMGNQTSLIIITQIRGLHTDTNPSVVGVAAALAVWKAFRFEISFEMHERLEHIVFHSWEQALDSIPRFA